MEIIYWKKVQSTEKKGRFLSVFSKPVIYWYTWIHNISIFVTNYSHVLYSILHGRTFNYCLHLLMVLHCTLNSNYCNFLVQTGDTYCQWSFIEIHICIKSNTIAYICFMGKEKSFFIR